jgi:hypothetical protein
MSKRALVFILVSLLVPLVVVQATEVQKRNSVDISKMRLINSNLLAPSMKKMPSNDPLITASPGEQVGVTYNDYQTNGSSGNRIVIDPVGRVHYNWMNGIGYIDPTNPNPRNIWYGYKNLITPSDSLTARQINAANRAGYTTLDTWYDAARSRWVGAAFYHNATTINSLVAIDTFPFTARFRERDIPGDTLGGQTMTWPYGAVDMNNNIHSVATTGGTTTSSLQIFGYWRSTDGGATWATQRQIMDTVTTISAVVASAPSANKVAIAYTHPRYEIMGTTGPAQYDNDVMYMESTDGGATWGPKINITNYPNIPTTVNDTVSRAYTDVDLIYDFNNNLHILWNAPYAAIDTVGGVTDTILFYRTALWHWSAASGIDLVFEHPTRQWRCDMGVWNLPICKMSLSVDSTNNVFAIFTGFNSNDAFDLAWPRQGSCGTSQACCNGDLYVSWSTNGGNSWAQACNMTFSFSPNCTTGVCDNDNWSSAAELAGYDSLHILYINDKDAGGVVQTEGDPTLNPVMYMKFPNPVTNPPQYAGIFPYSGGSLTDSLIVDQADSMFVLFYNLGDATLEAGIDDTAAWLTTTPDTLTVAPFEEVYLKIDFNATGLAVGMYTAELNFTSNDPFNPGPTAISCTLWVLSATPPCDYMLGDINGSGSVIGSDVTFAVRYFKGVGAVPPDSCYDVRVTRPGGFLYVAGDVNASCSFAGSDVTRLVSFFKGAAVLQNCSYFPLPMRAGRQSINLWKDKPAPQIIPSIGARKTFN